MEENVPSELHIFEEGTREYFLYKKIKNLENAVFDERGGIEMNVSSVGTVISCFPTTRYMKFEDEIKDLKSKVNRLRNGCIWLTVILMAQLFFVVVKYIWRFINNIL